MNPSRGFLWVLSGALLCLAASAQSASWTFTWASPSPQGNDLNAVDFVSPSSPIGWAVGKHGAAVRTTDGGATWLDRSAYASTQLYLWDVAAVSADIAVACELSGGIWRTVDGGITWDLVYQEPGHRDLVDLDQPVPGLIVAVGDRVVVRSTDAGASWKPIVHEDVEGALTDQLWFDANHGMFPGEFGIFSTDDGGVTMTPAAIDGPNMPFVCLDVRGDDGLAIATDGVVSFSFLSDDGGASWSLPVVEAWPYMYDVVILESGTALAGTYGEVWASDDMGLSWEIRYTDSNFTASIRDLDLRAGGVIQQCGGFGELGVSTDDGFTFTSSTTCPTGRRRCSIHDIDRLPDGSLVGVGVGTWASQLITSVDDGLTWSSVDAPSLRIGRLEFRTLDSGIVAGIDVIASTSDGGSTWTTTDLANIPGVGTSEAQIRDIAHRAGTSWFAAMSVSSATMSGAVIASDDDGLTWQRRDIGLPDQGYIDIEFVDPTTGYVATMPGSIYETLDAGVTWHLLNDDLIGRLDTLVEMTWLSPETVLMAADQVAPFVPGGIWRSSDRGESWEWVLAAIPVIDLDMLDGSTALAVRKPSGSGYGASVFASGDGGRNWTEIGTPFQQRYGGYDHWFAARSAVVLVDGFLLGGESSELIRGYGNPAVDVAQEGGSTDIAGTRLQLSRRVGRYFDIGVPVGDGLGVGDRLHVLDVRGRRVNSLALSDGIDDGSWRWVTWSGRDRRGRDVPAGVYFLQLRGKHGASATDRVVLMR